MKEQTFHGLLFRKVDHVHNQNRYYLLLWQQNLFGEWELLRIWGRAGTNRQRMKGMPYPDIAAAWPEIRRIVRRRLQHGYRVLPLR